MNRRNFLHSCLQAGLGAGAAAAMGRLNLMQAAMAASSGVGDYKALVCVFLAGGNDGFNMVVPTDSYFSTYAATRASLANEQASLLALSAAAPPAGEGEAYGLHAGMEGLQSLFNSSNAAVLANVGTLVVPTSQVAYRNGSVPLPPHLFSHNDQQALWQSPSASAVSQQGWLGRVMELVAGQNTQSLLPSAICLTDQSLLLTGSTQLPYGLSPYGAVLMNAIDGVGAQPSLELARAAVFNSNTNAVAAHVFERTYNDVHTRAQQFAQAHINATAGIAAPPEFAGLTSFFAAQLGMVAKTIEARAAIGAGRQAFFVLLGGFDTHDAQLTTQPALLADLSSSLKAFHDATVRMQVSQQVTTFTASDFGRTLSSNGDGSDHGWGSHHFVVGGSVLGQRFHGTMPSLASEASNPDDAGRGRIIPTTSVDSYAATLARWFGLSESDIDLVLPNIGEFNRDLGFMG